MSGITFNAGLPVIANDLTDIVYQNEELISAQAVSSGSDTTTSASYANMAGTGATTSFSFTKALTSTRVKIELIAGWSSGTNSSVMRAGALVNGTDYDCGQIALGTGVTGYSAGFAVITGLAAGTYTVQARWKRVSGSGTPTRDSNMWLSMSAAEIT